MNIGKRIIYDKNTGKVLNEVLNEMSGDAPEGVRGTEIEYIDLPFGDTTLQDAETYHIDITTKKIVVDTAKQHIPTYAELQQQLLVAQGVV